MVVTYNGKEKDIPYVRVVLVILGVSTFLTKNPRYYKIHSVTKHQRVSS